MSRLLSHIRGKLLLNSQRSNPFSAEFSFIKAKNYMKNNSEI
jgi:hypothetical protein